MTKQETIAKAYGEHWDKSKKYVDIDGWIDFAFAPEKFLREKKFDAITNKEERLLRPKSLTGIETNNGWIKIESQDDLPKEETDVHFIFQNKNGRFQTFGVWDNKIKSFYSGALKISNVTHYQPIVKPEPPIY